MREIWPRLSYNLHDNVYGCMATAAWQNGCMSIGEGVTITALQCYLAVGNSSCTCDGSRCYMYHVVDMLVNSFGPASSNSQVAIALCK